MFTDDYSSYRVTYGLPNKTLAAVYDCFVKYIAFAERQTGQRLKHFSLDGGGEFINHLLSPHLEELGIITRVTAPHTAEQNGVSERYNHTINSPVYDDAVGSSHSVLVSCRSICSDSRE